MKHYTVNWKFKILLLVTLLFSCPKQEPEHLITTNSDMHWFCEPG